jgi:predicted Zn-dependent protease
MRRPTLVVLLVLLALPLAAHEGLHEQIAELTERIAADPGNAALYLRRGELHRLHSELDLAAQDYDQAARLDPTLAGVALGRGMMLFDAGRFADAIPQLRQYIATTPADVRGRIALARTLMKAGRPADAAAEFAAALEQSAPSDPDLVLERAGALAAAGKRDEALRFLDTTMAASGPLVTFQLAAIDLEVQAGNIAGALRRIDAAQAAAARKETWLAQRGDVLLQAGRPEEARVAYQAALDAIGRLPEERRRTRAIVQLEERLRAEISR